MRKIILGLLAPLALISSGCALLQNPPASPSAVAGTTTTDEKVALGVEAIYQGWRAAVDTGLDLGLIKGDTAAKVQDLDNKIYAAVKLARSAYDAGNAASYAAASAEVVNLVAQGMTLIKGSN